MSPARNVEWETKGTYVRLVLDRPPVNAFTLDMFSELHDSLYALRSDARPVVLTGIGGIFSAGYDIKQQIDGVAVGDQASRCLEAIQSHGAPVLAAVEGAAVGLGLLIAMSADILVVSRSARLRMPEVTLGIISDVAPLRRFLPDPWIRRVCLLGDVYTAEELHLDSAGAILCPPGNAEAAAVALLDSIAEIDSDFLRKTKSHLYQREQQSRR